MKRISTYKCPDGTMKQFISNIPHYVVEPLGAKHSNYLYVFDWENLMRWILSSPKNDFEVYYADEIHRLFWDDSKTLLVNGWHLQKTQKLLNQAAEYKQDISVMKEYNRVMEMYDSVNLRWRDCYIYVPYSEKHKDDYFVIIRGGHRRHTTCSYKTPKGIWSKTKFENRMKDSLMDYEDDYSRFVTKKGRHTSCEMGWWDDYRRARRSTGWKENSKRKHQGTRGRESHKRDYFFEELKSELLLIEE